jgi:hypothetical protein
MVVDTTMPNSIIAEAFRKYRTAKRLRDVIVLEFPYAPCQNHPLRRPSVDLHAAHGLFSILRLSGQEVR